MDRYVVVGGGASGALVVAQLARQAREPIEVTVVEPRERLGRGIAYDTDNPRHLLNVPSRAMSALPDRPDHFHRWAGGSSVDFCSRARYGEYLEAVLRESWRRAPEGSTLQHLRDTVTGLSHLPTGAMRLVTASGAWLYADGVVLATGHGKPLQPNWLDPVAEVVVPPWTPRLTERIGGEGQVLCVGTGLTAVDVALEVLAADPRARVTAVSRRGLVPAAHRLPLSAPRELDLGPGPVRLRPLIRTLRSVEGDWRAVVDGLRPLTPEIWASFTPVERRSFVTHVDRYWEAHRHRMAPEVARRLEHYRHAGRLRFLACWSPSASMWGGQAHVRLGAERLRVDAIVTCFGPGPALAGTELGNDLESAGLARPGPFGLGVDCDPLSGALIGVSGRVDDRIVTIGPLRRGVLWESTAIGEIRAQASAVAGHLLTQRVPIGT